MSNFGGLTKYLNSATLNANKLSITNIDIEQIAENANNFYGLRDIEELASMIATSEYIEPLEVVPAENGSYRLIAGHRRRAAISLLISQGLRESKEVPCIIRNFSPANGLTADEIETINLIFSNRGQRIYCGKQWQAWLFQEILCGNHPEYLRKPYAEAFKLAEAQHKCFKSI